MAGFEVQANAVRPSGVHQANGLQATGVVRGGVKGRSGSTPWHDTSRSSNRRKYSKMGQIYISKIFVSFIFVFILLYIFI